MALALSLSVLPVAALAQDANANPPAPPTDAQRQQMRQTFEQFRQQAEQLHQQMRAQILGSINPTHLREIGATIGQLAIAQNPDMQAAARQIDRILSGSERQRILALRTSFAAQMKQLHEQMRSQIQNEMPAGSGHGPMMNKPPNGMMHHMTSDPGTMLLMALSPHPMMGMMGGHPGMP